MFFFSFLSFMKFMTKFLINLVSLFFAEEDIFFLQKIFCDPLGQKDTSAECNSGLIGMVRDESYTNTQRYVSKILMLHYLGLYFVSILFLNLNYLMFQNFFYVYMFDMVHDETNFMMMYSYSC